MTLDLSSLFHATVNFESLERIMEEFSRTARISSYPPYNILKLKKNIYRISIALAGFKIEDLAITLEENILIIKSSKIMQVFKRPMHKKVLSSKK